MNVLVMNYEYPPIGGGGASVSEDIAIELVKKGHAVTVITMGYKGLPKESVEHGVRVLRIPCLRKDKTSCSFLEALSYLFSLRLFFKYHDVKRYDICHAHFIIPTAIGAKYINLKYGIPYIITAHGSDVEGHNNKRFIRYFHRILRQEWRKTVSNSSYTVAPSSYLMDLMRKSYPCDKYIKIPNGINFELFQAHTVHSSKEKLILIMGRLQKGKNVPFAINAFSKLKDNNEWKLVIAGDGPEREKVKENICDLMLNDKVKMIGWIDHLSKEYFDCLSKSAVYISASKFENFPVSVIEAIAAGCYPLVSDIPAHRELLSKEYLFNLDDEEELIHKLSERISPGVMKNDVRMEQYDIRNITKEYEKIMLQAIKEKEPQK